MINKFFIGSCCIALIFVMGCYLISQHYVIQISSSMPRGLYKKIPISKPIERGQLVLIHLPEEIKQLMLSRKWIPKYLTYHLMKPVAAIQGDHVRVNLDGVYINGEYQGAVKRLDRQGIALPQLKWNAIIEKDMFFVLGNFANSFDSRYFGPVHLKDIVCVVE